MSWRWITRSALLLHDESLVEHGSAAGLRNEGLLDSALGRPVNLLTKPTLSRRQILQRLQQVTPFGSPRTTLLSMATSARPFWQPVSFSASTATV